MTIKDSAGCGLTYSVLCVPGTDHRTLCRGPEMDKMSKKWGWSRTVLDWREFYSGAFKVNKNMQRRLLKLIDSDESLLACCPGAGTHYHTKFRQRLGHYRILSKFSYRPLQTQTTQPSGLSLVTLCVSFQHWKRDLVSGGDEGIEQDLPNDDDHSGKVTAAGGIYCTSFST